MLSENSEAISNPVFFSRKYISDDALLTVRTELEPVESEHRCGYSFSLELRCGNVYETAELSDVTSSQKTAEGLFDLLTSQDVYPCHLRDVAEDYLSSRDTDTFGGQCSGASTDER